MLESEREIQEGIKTAPGPQLEMFVVAALLYSDPTSLASFGSTSLWPVCTSSLATPRNMSGQSRRPSLHIVSHISQWYEADLL